MNQRNADDNARARAAIVERLSRATVPLSARDIAHSIRLPMPLVHECLISLQRDGVVACQRRRWKLRELPPVKKRDPLASNSSRPGLVAPPRRQIQKPHSHDKLGGIPAAADTPKNDGDARTPPQTSTSSLKHSRWGTFRSLCQYYAECVRLDQGTTVHGKADQENWKFVSLAGNLGWPEGDEPPQMMIEIPRGWSEFIKYAKQGTHLYLGAPLNRYLWKDSTSGQETVFVSPVFLTPVAFDVSQTTLHLRALGPVRINDGWLERRLKNSEDRRVFLELCGFDLDESDSAACEPHYRSFAPFCDLLSHYYAKWCAEPLDIHRLRTSPALSHLQDDGIYNRAALFVPGKWRYTARLHDELLKLAWQTTDDELVSVPNLVSAGFFREN